MASDQGDPEKTFQAMSLDELWALSPEVEGSIAGRLIYDHQV